MENAEIAAETGSREFWRLGHRRRWWQWNVLTLFGGLFLLIWARELLGLSQTSTWMTCVSILAMWAFAPLGIVPSREAGPIRTVRALCGVAGILILLLILMEVGLVFGVLNILAAILLAVMIGARHP